MTAYVYRARTIDGRLVRGEILADAVDAARMGLQERTLLVTALAPKRLWNVDLHVALAGGAARERVAFFRAFATLTQAGVAIGRALNVAIDRSTNPGLNAALREILGDVERGEALSAAFGKRPRQFSPLIVAMVAAGESGGILDDILERIATFLERDAALRKTLVAALAYPATVLTASIALLTFLIVRVVPMFTDLFTAFHADLPLSTRVLMSIGTACSNPFVWVAGLLATTGGVAAFAAARRTPGGRRFFERCRFRIPIVGALVRKTIVARTARMLGTLVHAGVELSVALDVITPACGSIVYQEALERVALALREGDALTPPLTRSGLFDALFLTLTGVGEETGMLDAMLAKAATAFEDDIAAAVATLGAVIEPALIVVLGVIVGLIVYSVFIPLYSLVGAASR